MEHNTSGISIGKLLAMLPTDRDKVIPTLSKKVKRKLAHLASYSMQNRARKVAEYNNEVMQLAQILKELTREEVK